MPDPSAPIPAAEPPANMIARVGAFLVALCILIGGAIFSLGTVLFAPAGMAITTRLWRRRGRALPIVGHWIAAVTSVSALLVILAAVGASLVPRSALLGFKRTMDSATVASQRQAVGRGIARATPSDTAKGTGRLPRATSLTFTTITMSFGAAVVVIVFGAIFGSIGWAAGMLLGFAVKGRWPGAVSAVPFDAPS